MDKKKQHILAAAMGLFVEKGFPQTSVQDIAESCNVSKTTIYKIFTCKEDIAIDVILYIQEQLVADLLQVEQHPGWNDKEKMRSTILLLLNHYEQRTRFIDHLHLFLSQEQRKQYLPVLTKYRFVLFDHCSTIIGRMFHLPTKSMAWEVNLAMHGILREITLMETPLSQQLFIPKFGKDSITNFILDTLLAISNQRQQADPLITADKIAAIKKHFAIDEEEESYCPSIERVLQQLTDELINTFPKNDQKNGLRAVELISQEWQKDTVDFVLLKGLMLYLAQYQAQLPSLNELNRLLTELE